MALIIMIQIATGVACYFVGVLVGRKSKEMEISYGTKRGN